VCGHTSSSHRASPGMLAFAPRFQVVPMKARNQLSRTPKTHPAHVAPQLGAAAKRTQLGASRGGLLMGVLSVALSSTLCPATAAAQAARAPAPAPGDDARPFYAAAQRAFNEGRYVDAAHGFEQAFKLKPHPAPLINAGDAWDKAGEYALAARAYQSV